MILSTHMKSQMQQCVPITLVLDSGEEEEMDAWNSLASQPSRVSELQVHRETLSHREDDPSVLLWPPQAYAYMHPLILTSTSVMHTQNTIHKLKGREMVNKYMKISSNISA